jgi:hypothetical protein
MIPSVFPSYLGFAQAMVEGNYPFDVAFGGDGHYVRDRLRLEDLRGYSAIVVPSPVEPTENQKRIIAQFVTAGGTLVTQEPERLGIDVEFGPDDRPYLAGVGRVGEGRVLQLAGKVTPTWTNDIGSEFFQSYTKENRQAIWDLADVLGVRSLLAGKCDGAVGVFPVVQPDHRRTVVHLVNYDIDIVKDETREQPSFTIQLPSISPPGAKPHAELFAPGVKTPLSVPLGMCEGTIRCTIPRLGSCATLVIRGD